MNYVNIFRVSYKMAAKSAQQVRQMIGSGDYFSFLVVRHPLDRVLSAFRDRILDGCTGQSIHTVPKIFLEEHDSRARYGTSPLFNRDTGCIIVFPNFVQFVRHLVRHRSNSVSSYSRYVKNLFRIFVA